MPVESSKGCRDNMIRLLKSQMELMRKVDYINENGEKSLESAFAYT